MNKKIVFIFLLSCCIILSNGALAQNVYISEYPPFCYTKDGKVTGFATEIVSEIMQRIGVYNNISSLPWKRAYKYLSDRPDIILFTVTRTKAREELFKWVGPITISSLVFFAKKNSFIKINRMEEAKKLRIGTVQGYSSEKFLIKEGFTNIDSVAGSEKSNPLKLMAGRIDLWATVDIVGIYNARLLGVDRKKMKAIYTIKKQPKYIAFSRQTDDLTIERWQKALNEIRKDGTFDRILSNWMK
ncbi:MAG: amino acid ABC transporter substrate-binding protein [Desulfobacterales bacterium]|nr:amino acid ABC transporter substrate-binding protein [Desulfobacterales bacterium]